MKRGRVYGRPESRKGVAMFDGLRKKRDERRRERARADFERAAAETTTTTERVDPRARELPDQLGEEMRRTGINPPSGL